MKFMKKNAFRFPSFVLAGVEDFCKNRRLKR
jgi:hypothetical protein